MIMEKEKLLDMILKASSANSWPNMQDPESTLTTGRYLIEKSSA